MTNVARHKAGLGSAQKTLAPEATADPIFFLHLFLCSGGLCLKHIVGSLTHTSDSDNYIYCDFFLKVKNVQKSVLIQPEKNTIHDICYGLPVQSQFTIHNLPWSRYSLNNLSKLIFIKYLLHVLWFK